MSNDLAGVCYLAINGKSYAIAGAGSYRVSSPTAESLMGQDGYHGVKKMPSPGKISWTGRDLGNMSMSELANMDDVTVTLELANGKMIVGRNMSRVGEPPTVNTEEASFDIEFEGPSVTEA